MTGPNPTDRGKSGTKHHVVVSTDGLPLAVIPSSANAHDATLFPELLRPTQVVCTTIGRLHADAGYDSADNRWLCLRDGVRPHIRKIGEPHGSGLGKVRCIVDAWLRLAARRQAPGPATGSVGADHPRPAHGRRRPHHREPPHRIRKTAP